MFFGYSVRSPHRTAKPSRGCLRVVGLKPHADFPPCKRRGTKVINKKPNLRRGCTVIYCSRGKNGSTSRSALRARFLRRGKRRVADASPLAPSELNRGTSRAQEAQPAPLMRRTCNLPIPSVFSLYSVRSPNRTTKPSRWRLRVVVGLKTPTGRGGSAPAEPGVRHGMRQECDRSATRSATGVRQECDRSATGVRQECDRSATGVRQI